MVSVLTPLKGVSKQDCMASTEGKVLRDYIGRYTAGSKTIVQNKVPVGLNVSWQFSRKTGSKEQKHSVRVTIQTTLKHLVSLLNSCQAVHKRYRAASYWQNGRRWPRSEVAIESLYISADIWQLTALLRCGFTSALTLMSPTLLFFAPKIADVIILYARRCSNI